MSKSGIVGKMDQNLMQLAHYFITVENYTPMVVRGVQNEIWLENLDAPYRIIRINANHVHNDEQLGFDLYKIKKIVQQVKRKTLSFSLKTLNILLDSGPTIEQNGTKDIDCVFFKEEEDIKKNSKLNDLFPTMKENLIDPKKGGIEFVINVTNDINMKTTRENDAYEEVFRKKDGLVTKLLIAINIIMFIIANVGLLTRRFDLYTTLSLNKLYVQNGDFYRLLTSAFMHSNLFHLLMNMYSLYIIGYQVESYVGKGKYLGIYLFSAIIGGMLSCVVNGSTTWSLGASGAIFGLMGALVYFGYHYRMYLDKALRTQIIPLILLNLLIGFMYTNIDNAGHIGGLVGGLFITMALGIKNKSTTQDTINGVICSAILFGFLCYMLFFL